MAAAVVAVAAVVAAAAVAAAAVVAAAAIMTHPCAQLDLIVQLECLHTNAELLLDLTGSTHRPMTMMCSSSANQCYVAS